MSEDSDLAGKKKKEKKVKNLKITVDAVEVTDQEKDVNIGYVDRDFSPVNEVEVFDDPETGGDTESLEKFGNKKNPNKPVVFHVTVKDDINKDLDEIYRDKFVENEALIDEETGLDEPFIPLERNPEKSMEFDTAELDTPENNAKKVARAERFGIKGTEEDFSILDDRIRSLYAGFGISDPDKLERSRVWEVETNRYDSIHLHGVGEMSTSDIFRYFEEFAPGRIEWIDDQTCNVKFKDKRTAGKTMLLISQPMKPINRPKKKIEEGEVIELEDEEVDPGSSDEVDGVSPLKRIRTDDDQSAAKEEADSNEKKDEDVPMVEIEASQSEIIACNDEEDHPRGSVDSVEVTEVTEEGSFGFTDTDKFVEVDLSENTVPPGKWRVAIKHTPRAELLLMRFATISDRKNRGGERKSQFYVEHGGPNGGITGIISGSSRKRKHGRRQDFEDEDDYDEDFEGSRSLPFGDLRSRLYNRRKYEPEAVKRKPYNDLDTVIDADGNEVVDEDVELEEWTEHDDRDLTYYDEVIATRNRLRQEQKARNEMPPPGEKKKKTPAMRMRADEEEKSRSKRREQRMLLGLNSYDLQRDSRMEEDEEEEEDLDWPPRGEQFSEGLGRRQRRYSQGGTSGNIRDRLGSAPVIDDEEVDFEDESDYLEDYDDFASDYRSRREDRTDEDRGHPRRRRSRSFSAASVETYPRGGTATLRGLRGAAAEKGRWRPPTDLTRMKVTVENT